MIVGLLWEANYESSGDGSFEESIAMAFPHGLAVHFMQKLYF